MEIYLGCWKNSIEKNILNIIRDGGHTRVRKTLRSRMQTSVYFSRASNLKKSGRIL